MDGTSGLSNSLRAALAALDEAGVPDELREIAFGRALDATLGGFQGSVPSGRLEQPGAGGAGIESPRGDGSLSGLAQRLGIELAAAEAIYDVDEEGLHLVIAPSKLDTSVTAAMEQIARLVVAGRQAVGVDDEWTPIGVVRAACENRGRYSRGNFSTYVSKLDGDGFRIRGTGTSREFKANAAGFESTGHLATRLVAQE
jgi:hypothetical protein